MIKIKLLEIRKEELKKLKSLVVNILHESMSFPVHKYKKCDECNVGEYTTYAKLADDINNIK